jgi:ATP-dependent Clp protease ATP-binding subunit ClpA
MPKINVYLPDDLAEAVRATGVPVSSICQRALETAVREAKTVTITPTFERFTPRARAVVAVAADLAAADGADLGSEHVLRGLLTGEGISAKALQALGVNDDLVTKALEQRSSTADGSPVYLAALQEALKLGHNYIGTEHMLLGIASTNCTASDVLSDLGITASGLRSHVISTLTGMGIPAPLKPAAEAGLATKLDELIHRIGELEKKLSS